MSVLVTTISFREFAGPRFGEQTSTREMYIMAFSSASYSVLVSEKEGSMMKMRERHHEGMPTMTSGALGLFRFIMCF